MRKVMEIKTRLKAFAILAALALPVLAHAQSEPNIWERSVYGSVPGITQVKFSGNNGGITTTYEAVWPESSAYAVRTAAMSTPYCASSDNTNDKAAGTGCLTMSVSGVTTAYAPFTETVTMNGQTSVNLTTANVLFINSLTCLTAGSTGANTGTIRCGTGSNTSGVPAVVDAHMAIGFGMSDSAMYMVPANKSMICSDWNFATSGLAQNIVVKFALDTYTDPVSAKLLQRRELTTLNQSAGSQHNMSYMRAFPAKTLVIVEALGATSTGPVNVSVDCLLIDAFTSNSNQVNF